MLEAIKLVISEPKEKRKAIKIAKERLAPPEPEIKKNKSSSLAGIPGLPNAPPPPNS